MGFVSYLEDITDRLTDDLGRLRESIAVNGDRARSHGQYAAVMKWIGDAESVLKDLRAHLDLASDPDVELAHRVVTLERESTSLRHSLTVAERQLREHQAVVVQLKAEITAADRRKRQAERALGDFQRANPAALYEKYSTPDRMRRFKPDDE